MSRHIYQAEQQVQTDLFLLRSRARTKDIERRSQMNETVDRDDNLDAEIQENYQKNTMNKLIHAEDTIVQLLNQNSAFLNTIRYLAETWGKPLGGDSAELADRIVDEKLEKIETQSDADLREWARDQMVHGRKLSRAKVKKSPKPPKM